MRCGQGLIFLWPDEALGTDPTPLEQRFLGWSAEVDLQPGKLPISAAFILLSQGSGSLLSDKWCLPCTLLLSLCLSLFVYLSLSHSLTLLPSSSPFSRIGSGQEGMLSESLPCSGHQVGSALSPAPHLPEWACLQGFPHRGCWPSLWPLACQAQCRLRKMEEQPGAAGSCPWKLRAPAAGHRNSSR